MTLNIPLIADTMRKLAQTAIDLNKECEAMKAMLQDETADLSAELTSVRRAMRAKVLALDDPELHNLYYRAITLSEHEAARGALTAGKRGGE